MDMQAQIDGAKALCKMHGRSSALLLNAWCAVGVRLLVLRAFAAMAATSGGVAWSLGHADGERVSRASGFSRPVAQRLFGLT